MKKKDIFYTLINDKMIEIEVIEKYKNHIEDTKKKDLSLSSPFLFYEDFLRLLAALFL
jgi:hypothetical protein